MNKIQEEIDDLVFYCNDAHTRTNSISLLKAVIYEIKKKSVNSKSINKDTYMFVKEIVQLLEDSIK